MSDQTEMMGVKIQSEHMPNEKLPPCGAIKHTIGQMYARCREIEMSAAPKAGQTLKVIDREPQRSHSG